MKNVRINRVASNPKEGTFGALTLDGQPICLTLEAYSRDNTINVSCVNSGQYICKRINSPKYGDVFEVTNIQNRTNVLFHWGNWDDDTKGCILLGEEYIVLDNRWAVGSSKKAFNEFMKKLKDESEFILTISECY
jgi:hypothetical protein